MKNPMTIRNMKSSLFSKNRTEDCIEAGERYIFTDLMTCKSNKRTVLSISGSKDKVVIELIPAVIEGYAFERALEDAMSINRNIGRMRMKALKCGIFGLICAGLCFMLAIYFESIGM